MCKDARLTQTYVWACGTRRSEHLRGVMPASVYALVSQARELVAHREAGNCEGSCLQACVDYHELSSGGVCACVVLNDA